MVNYMLISTIFFGVSVITTPGPLNLGSLTILKENDLYAQYSNKTSTAIFVEQTRSFLLAKSTCSSLSETLWSPELQYFTAGVADHAGHTCKAIDLAGKVGVLDCNRLLPSLCTHTAPLSNISFWDTAENYRVVVNVGSRASQASETAMDSDSEASGMQQIQGAFNIVASIAALGLPMHWNIEISVNNCMTGTISVKKIASS
ncbi:hypothetical protein H072_4345 [Dactylellina haptotyla CBS 200.50]|uniref:Uncharacterized protein n=1 Tax=Dactylellina haptotyla (strain CBS 200.50) TaxID=1284197 RepID=S8AFB6_DACHA|nr:hypothetical protein H072_4345 [Dactylellina haptotyla CBS 200.50]